MKYNRKSGEKIMKKYLNTDELQTRLKHSEGVAELAFKIAKKISNINPELVDFNPELVGFLGYVHDIGYSVANGKHEVHTVNILINNEDIPKSIARKAMHGQLAEQFGEKEGNVSQYLPIRIEGMVITYADMSVRTGEPIPIRERAKEIIDRIQGIPTMPQELKQDITANMYKALPRFERYEENILSLAKVDSIKEF